jgi:hypothetical protein
MAAPPRSTAFDTPGSVTPEPVERG